MHLFVVMTNICANGMHLLLSVSSIKPNMQYDRTCEFAGGEHQFITVPSFVFYRRPEQRAAVAIDQCIQSGYFVAHAALDAGHFHRICDGVVSGLGKYISRRPCKRGHIAERRTETGYCIECERLVQQTPKRKEYMRRYMRTLRVARKAL